MVIVPGSYIPHFTYPHNIADLKDHDFADAGLGDELTPSEEKKAASSKPTSLAVISEHRSAALLWSIAILCLLFAGTFVLRSIYKPDPQYLFWKPVLDANGPVLLAVGDVPNGPPTASSSPQGDQGTAIPIVQKASSPTVPFADTVTIARVVGILQARRKDVIIRPESQSSFSDLRQNPAILIGAFNNEWSLRLTQQLRYTLALDPDRHLIYIRDARRPSARDWSWPTDERSRDQGGLGGPALQDYALISRIWDSRTGNVVVVIGGLYTYGTEAAGEALTSRNMMEAISKSAPLNNSHRNIQVVLSTTVTDGTAGPPKLLAVSAE
jgi:hypothetical protein